MKKNIIQHSVFWLIYTLVYAYLNTSFPAASDLEYTWPWRFWRFWQGEVLMLPLKLLATYGFLYGLLPHFILQKKYAVAILYSILGLLPIVLGSRLMTYYVVYPMLYHELPTYELISIRRGLYSFLDILSAVSVASMLQLLRSRLASQQREEALKREKLQSELHFLRAQTNPHFLFNTLNNIYALARKQSEATAPVVMKLSKIMRFMLYECTAERISLGEEIQVIQDYIDLEKLRYNERLNIVFEVVVDDNQQEIAPLLLLPFVENAFKHGASETRFKTVIVIQLMLKNQQLTFNIKNTRDVDMISDNDGIGLTNVKRQLDLIYPKKYQLSIDSEGEMYQVGLSLFFEDV